jgi:hypothetical protein
LLDEHGRRFLIYSGDYDPNDDAMFIQGSRRDLARTQSLRRAQHLKDTALLQVCRQIRSEFRDMYLQTPLHLHLARATTYLEAFYSLTHPSCAQTKTLKCSVSLHTTAPENAWKKPSIDITPLLQHLYALPSVNFNFISETLGTFVEAQRLVIPVGDNLALNDVFGKDGHGSVWSHVLSLDVQRVTFFYHSHKTPQRNMEVLWYPDNSEAKAYRRGESQEMNEVMEVLGLVAKAQPAEWHGRGQLSVVVKCYDEWRNIVEREGDGAAYRSKVRDEWDQMRLAP